jgi:hypothetical protein
MLPYLLPFPTTLIIFPFTSNGRGTQIRPDYFTILSVNYVAEIVLITSFVCDVHDRRHGKYVTSEVTNF